MNRPDKIKIINKDGQDHVFDIIRKKYVLLTPEENVRQQFLHYLIDELNYPPSLIAVEKGLPYLDKTLRADIVVHDRNGQAQLIVECKAPQVTLDQNSFDQIARYNLTLKVAYLVVCNGHDTRVCRIHHERKEFEYLEAIPAYEQL